MTSPLDPSIEGFLQAADNVQLLGNAEVMLSAAKQSYDFAKTYSVQSPCKDDNSDVKGIQRALKNLQNDISKLKRFSNINSAVDALINEDVEPGKTIKKIVKVATGDISGYVKNILGRVRGWALNEVQKGVKRTLPYLFPSEAPAFTRRVNGAVNGLSCAFAKIVRELAKTIGSLLLALIDEYINGPMCLAQDFLGSLLDKILEPIGDALSDIVSAFSRFPVQIAANAFNAIEFLTGILSFFTCDDDKKCPTQDEITRGGEGVKSDKGGDPPGKTGQFSSPSDGGGPLPLPGAAYPTGQGNNGSTPVSLQTIRTAANISFPEPSSAITAIADNLSLELL